ncbi:TetR/AcrR family transcriptional regulator [Streptomyces sp. NEAU-174]|uniref:TetR/AcrR family transcriptional regulator n=1 Tax=Streptomyces sp. NEAU-174 TaxID=3458254 RepID=UPI004044BC4B
MSSTSQLAENPGASGTGDTRERIVRSASRLLQRQGYEGTGIKLIARAAGATLGSVYHFFPGGKEQLAVAAIQHGRQEFTEMLRVGLGREEDSAAQALENCSRHLAESLRKSDWADGCPVTTTALETLGRIPAIEEACVQALGEWQDVIADRLQRAGFDETEADALASTVLSTLEGAETLSQVHRSEGPLLHAGRHLAALVESRRGEPAAGQSEPVSG